ncbi:MULTISPECIES: NUDIX domain-containing protein [Flavobacteriaceae]|uniref:NUDIX domain-containing protein n=1 Tax=Flavobacteriaceae TaxID=49546 RepID=UPI0010ADD3CE|nr:MULTISPECIES: NUDIX domain-containing protein [Flavobacteriaceae]NJB35260.1 NUDIX domain-containing protein [Croceivirga sp. JEA036]TKD63528.1 NUDIX domain-containing protein [Flavobacterium sp. ASW18X]
MKKIFKSRLVAIKDQKVLVMRKVGKRKQYTLPGGIRKKNETYIEALMRETAEEIALQLQEDALELFFTFIEKSKEVTYSKKYYYSKIEEKPIAVIETHKFTETLWLDYKEAIEYMDKTDRKAIKTYFKNKGAKEETTYVETYALQQSSPIQRTS